MKEFIDKTSTESGTKINRKNLMAMQGFINSATEFDGNVITVTNSDNETHTITFNLDGSITEVFSGSKTITKTTTFNDNGTITEVVN